MPYTINWYIPDEIIYIRYMGVVTLDDLRNSLLETHDFINSSPRDLVHVINDVGDVSETVKLTDSVRIVREVGGHERAGWSFTIRETSVLVKMSATIGSSIFKMRFKTFNTLDEAIAHLKFFDSAIIWENADHRVTQHIAV